MHTAPAQAHRSWLPGSLVGRLLALAALALAFAAPAAPCAAQIGSGEYRDEEHGFKLTPFPRWTRMDSGWTGKVDADSSDANPRRCWRITTVWVKGDSGPLTYPNVQLEVTDYEMSLLTIEDIERIFDAKDKLADPSILQQSKVATLFRQLEPKLVYSDRSRHRILQVVSHQVDKVGEVKELIITQITNLGFVSIVFGSEVKSLDLYEGDFQGFLDSFNVLPAAVYVDAPRSRDRGEWVATRNNFGRASPRRPFIVGWQRLLVLLVSMIGLGVFGYLVYKAVRRG